MFRFLTESYKKTTEIQGRSDKTKASPTSKNLILNLIIPNNSPKETPKNSNQNHQLGAIIRDIILPIRIKRIIPKEVVKIWLEI
jgi:hypothetical protein